MADRTKIEWASATWNPIRGCTRVSEGCRHCYAERQAFRFSGPGQPYEGLVKLVGDEPRWTGDVALVGSALEAPRRWQRRRRVFVDSMGDLFHERVPDLWIDKCFAVMAAARQHVFIILTKRPARMRAYLSDYDTPERIGSCAPAQLAALPIVLPLSNVQLGVSIEDQPTADQRLPELLATRAAVRIVSAEPLLGPVDAGPYLTPSGIPGNCFDIDGRWRHEPGSCMYCRPKLDGVIVGGESGPGARPMHPDWARRLRNQCAAAGVPYFFKQRGEWTWDYPQGLSLADRDQTFEHGRVFYRVGKRRAGRLLDGREHNDLPAHA